MNTNYNCNNTIGWIHFIMFSFQLYFRFRFEFMRMSAKKERRKEKTTTILIVYAGEREREKTRTALDFSYFDICAVCWLTRRKFTTVQIRTMLIHSLSLNRDQEPICLSVKICLVYSEAKEKEKHKHETISMMRNLSAKCNGCFGRHDRWWWWCCCCWLWVWWSIIHGLWNKLKSINVMCPGRMSV